MTNPAGILRPCSAEGGGAAGPARILIVDDDPNLLVLLADQLRNDGFEIQTARDGEEALRRLDGGWPDLLIVDMIMPRMDGLTLAREVKARADLPIIVLSAIDTADSKADLLEEVAEDYVTKPYHYPELRARIARVMRRLGDKVPRRELVLGPNLSLDLRRRRRRSGRDRAAHADRVAAPVRARREPRPTPSPPRRCSTAAGATPTTPTRPTSGSRCAGCARRSSPTPTIPIHLVTVRGIGYRLVTGAADGA